jgi:fluoride ion exporter CrcB/FEX
LQAKVLGAVFLGGAIGSIVRFLVILGVDELTLQDLSQELIATSIVNLAGAFLLGFVHVIGSSRAEIWKGFFGPGLAGGFTTMSGLALITAGAELGLSSVGYLYWIAVAIQLVLGILTYWLGTQLATRTSKKAAS